MVRSKWLAAVAALALFVPVGCSDSSGDGGAGVEDAHEEAIAALTGLLPGDARGALAADLSALLSGGASGEVAALLEGEGGEPALSEALGAIGSLAGAVDLTDVAPSVVLAQTTDPSDGPLLLADVGSRSLDEVISGSVPTPDGNHGPDAEPLYLDGEGNQLALLGGGVLVVGSPAAVTSVLDVDQGESPAGTSPIAPFLGALDAGSPISFASGLPALIDDEIEPDRSLRGAAVMSGSLDVEDGEVSGSLAFHSSDATAFVEAYNTLNRNATGGEDPSEDPLSVAEPIVDDLARVVVPLPPVPIDPSPEEAVASRNIAKKLFVGMEAHDYAEGVADEGNDPWVDLVVKSEADEDTPPSPGSVFIRWEFKDQAAIEAFEANELPAGFTLAPTQFLESDDPEGEYFLALNLYNSGGGSIVSGARAEWDVFVDPPEGADPDAGERPRFMVIDALAESVSADPVNLVTPAEPLSHAFVDDDVVTSVRRVEPEGEVPVFSSSFPTPDPAEAEVARFTREMAIGNDYIYWGHGVYDRVLYNATTFNHDAYFVPPEQIALQHDSRWAQYLKPTVKDAVYYVNTLEYVASPLANLDSDYLDITPEWLAELRAFKDNGHQSGLMRAAVSQLFRGASDALVGMRVANETPSTHLNFEITDPDALAEELDLPPGHALAPMTVLEDGAEGHYLSLSIFEVEGAPEGTRAEWSVYVDDGSGRPHQMIVDLMTAGVGVDPLSIINSPSIVDHRLEDATVTTRLSSGDIAFEASFDTEGASDESLALDWIESGDEVCYLNGICDKFFYDAETLDVPVHRPADVQVGEFSTPWDDLVSATPSVVFYRDNPQELAVKRWHNLKVPVEELPFSGLEDPTHAISGSGSLVGRDSDVVNSEYTYRGDAVVDGDELTFALDQEIDNALGIANIYTSGTFDLTTGTGTQTVVDCRGPDLMCSDIERGASALYTAQDLDVSDPEAISWQVDVVVELGGIFGTADSSSTFRAES